MDLRTIYTEYVSRINAQSDHDFSNFVSNGIVHNDFPPLTVEQYAQIIIDSQGSFRDLKFDVAMLVVEHEDDKGNGSIAVRIRLSYIPESEAHKDAGEARVEEFYEHVFYSFKQVKIIRVWSLLDGAGQKWDQERKTARGK